jgi:predicted peptidase
MNFYKTKLTRRPSFCIPHSAFCIALALALATASANAAPPHLQWCIDRTEAREFTGKDGGVFHYRIAEKKAPEGQKVPLVILLHGAGERGTDNTMQLYHGAYDMLKWLDEHEAGFRFVAGQVPPNQQWVDVPWESKSHDMPVEPSKSMALQLELLDALLADPAIDRDRVYVTGISMGGYGAWDILCRRPEVFAAVLPVCGGCDVAQAPRIAHVPIWAFHGSGDGTVPVIRARSIMSALWALGSDAHYREYPDVGHNVWTPTYRDATVLEWFFRQRRKDSGATSPAKP